MAYTKTGSMNMLTVPHVRLVLRALVLFLLSIVTVRGYGQQIILNTRGERIVVYPDGSWRYYERADSVLLNKNLFKEDVVETEKDDQMFDSTETNPEAEADISSLAIRFGEQIATELINAKQALASTVEDKFAAEARLEQAEENKKLIEPDILASLEDENDALTQKVKSQRKQVQWMEKMHTKTQEMLSLPVEKKPLALNQLVAEYNAHSQGNSTPEQEYTRLAASGQKTNAQSRTKNSSAANPRDSQAMTDIIEDTPDIYQRAPVPCIVSQAPSANAVSVQPQLLFTHTDEELRPYFRQQELVTCFASLVQIENKLYLSLEFQIASADARKNFGVLENNSMLRLKLIDGTFVNLFNARADQGKIDAYTGNTVYTGSYLIDRGTEKLLSNHELDKLRVVWSTGFEDYDVVHLDFLVNQFRCLRSQGE